MRQEGAVAQNSFWSWEEFLCCASGYYSQPSCTLESPGVPKPTSEQLNQNLERGRAGHQWVLRRWFWCALTSLPYGPPTSTLSHSDPVSPGWVFTRLIFLMHVGTLEHAGKISLIRKLSWISSVLTLTYKASCCLAPTSLFSPSTLMHNPTPFSSLKLNIHSFILIGFSDIVLFPAPQDPTDTISCLSWPVPPSGF